MPVKVYDGTNWVTVAGDGQAGAPGAAGTSSSIVTWVKTASGGETSVSGTGDTGYGTLAYTVGQELVYLNGVLLDRGDDYTATNGTSITGLTALAANDIVTVWTVNSFSVANTYTQAQSDARYPAKAGSVLQVVSTTYATATSIATSSYADTGLSLSITPSSATSKILVLTYQTFGTSRQTGQCGMGVQLLRGATVLTTPATDMFAGGASGAASAFLNNQVSISYLDSPATTSATTYKTQGKPETTANSSTLVAQYNNTTATMILMEIGA